MDKRGYNRKQENVSEHFLIRNKQKFDKLLWGRWKMTKKKQVNKLYCFQNHLEENVTK